MDEAISIKIVNGIVNIKVQARLVPINFRLSSLDSDTASKRDALSKTPALKNERERKMNMIKKEYLPYSGTVRYCVLILASTQPKKILNISAE